MNRLVKVLVPAVLSIAAFSASAAGNGQIPSYGGTPAVASASVAAAAVGSLAGAAMQFRGEESPMAAKAQARPGLTRAEVLREAAAANRAAVGSDRFTTGYINH